MQILSKLCTRCNETKALTEFSKNINRKDRLQIWCTKCVKNYNAENKDNNKNSDLKRTYGIDINTYRNMEAKQRGKCLICKSKCKSGRQLSVDHCHSTGQIRGLLCSNCNTGLGKFKDDVSLLESAILYLKKHTINNGGTL